MLCMEELIQTPLPVWVGGGQHELELHQAGAIGELPVLQAVQLIGEVPASHVDLEGDSGRYHCARAPTTHIHVPPQSLHASGAPPALTSSAAMRTTWLVW